MNRKLTHSFLLSVLALAFFLPAAVALAVDTNYVPLTTLPGVFKANTPTNPVKVISGLYGLAIGVGSVIAVVMVIYAGFEYMFQESIAGKSDAKQRIINAFLGLAVILGSYILLNTLNPDLVKFDVTLQGGTGKVGGLVAAQLAREEVAKINAIASNKLGIGLRKSESITAEADAIEKITIPGLINKLKELEEAGKRAGKSMDEIANSSAYKALVAEVENLTTKKEDLKKQAAVIAAEAREAGAQAARESLNKQTAITVATGSLSTIEEKLGGYQRALNTEIAAINSNPTLTAEQKTAKINQATNKTKSDEFLARQQIEAIKSSSDPSKLAAIKVTIAQKYSTLSDPRSTNLDPQQKETLRQEYLATQRAIDAIAQAQNMRDAEAREKMVKCAQYVMTNPLLGLLCI